MRLVIEPADKAITGLEPGEYDIDDLCCAVVTKPPPVPGLHQSVSIDLSMNESMVPEPGSVSGTPHFKVGIESRASGLASRTNHLEVFARPSSGQALGYKVAFTDLELKNAADPRTYFEVLLDPALDTVLAEVKTQLVTDIVARVSGKATPATPAAVMGGVCDECGGTGVWTNPAMAGAGATTPCSFGCPKP